VNQRITFGTDCSPPYVPRARRGEKNFGPPGTDIISKNVKIFGLPKQGKHSVLVFLFGAAKICLREYKLRHITQFSNKENAAEICGILLHTKDRFDETRKHSFSFGCRPQSPHSNTTANKENPRGLTVVHEISQSPVRPLNSTHHISC